MLSLAFTTFLLWRLRIGFLTLMTATRKFNLWLGVIHEFCGTVHFPLIGWKVISVFLGTHHPKQAPHIFCTPYFVLLLQVPSWPALFFFCLLPRICIALVPHIVIRWQAFPAHYYGAYLRTLWYATLRFAAAAPTLSANTKRAVPSFMRLTV